MTFEQVEEVLGQEHHSLYQVPYPEGCLVLHLVDRGVHLRYGKRRGIYLLSVEF